MLDRVPGRPIRVANCSGFFGDRISAAADMVRGGDIDFLTGDYLAELTMFILWKAKRRGRKGYAGTFLRQLEEVLGECVDRKIRIVTNAGGLSPAELADDIRALAARLQIPCNVAHIEGDDISRRIDELRNDGVTFDNIDTGESFNELTQAPVTANLYLGAWGIVDSLSMGADVVVGPRITDASLVVGPAAWSFGWSRDDWDRLASAVAAGHIIECGAQATGGNYSFFDELPDFRLPGLPIAEISSDGSAVITKHAGTGGVVSVGTVTAQILYEVGSSAYLNPDVTAYFDTIKLRQEGSDRVRVAGVVGAPPPADYKACLNLVGGYRNSVTFMLTGLESTQKAEMVRQQMLSLMDPVDSYDEVDIRHIRGYIDGSQRNEETVSRLTITAKSSDAEKVGRRFSNMATSLSLSSYPGFFTATPPRGEEQFGVYWPALVPARFVDEWAVGPDGERRSVKPTEERQEGTPASAGTSNRTSSSGQSPANAFEGEATKRVPLGLIVGARSGDKGAVANVGFWTRNAPAFDWMSAWLTTDRLLGLLPEASRCVIERFEFPNLLAINFLIRGLLAPGVAATSRPDPHAKGLGEFLRSRLVPIPIRLLGERSPALLATDAPST